MCVCDRIVFVCPHFFCLRGEERDPEPHGNSTAGNDNEFVLGNIHAWFLVRICLSVAHVLLVLWEIHFDTLRYLDITIQHVTSIPSSQHPSPHPKPKPIIHTTHHPNLTFFHILKHSCKSPTTLPVGSLTVFLIISSTKLAKENTT